MGLSIVVAFRRSVLAGTRGPFILVAWSPSRSAWCCSPAPRRCVTLALLFGLFNLIHGGWVLVQGIELRHTQHTLQSAVQEPHPA